MEYTSISPNLIRGKVDTMLLRSLINGDKYGLEISDYVKDSSGGTYVLKKPTLYSALHRLEKKKFISGYDKVENGIRRRYYKLTDAGRNSFQSHKDDWKFSREVIDTLFYDEMSTTRFGKVKYCSDAPDDLLNNGNNDTMGENLAVAQDNLEELDKSKTERYEEYINEHITIESTATTAAAEALTAAANALCGLVERQGETGVSTTSSDMCDIPEQDVVGLENIEVVAVDSAEIVASAAESDTQQSDASGVQVPAPANAALTNRVGDGGTSYVTQYFISGDYHVGNRLASGTSADSPFALPLTGETSTSAAQVVKDYVLAEKSLGLESYATPKADQHIFADEGIRRHEDGTLEVFFEKYISPNEYAVVNAQREINSHAPMMYEPEPVAVVEEVVSAPVVEEISPLLTPVFEAEASVVDAGKHTGIFILYNRLKAVIAPIVAVCTATILAILMATVAYSPGAEVMFILGFVTAGIYVLVSLTIWMVYPRVRKLTGNYKKELLIRLAITLSVIVATVGIMFAAGARASLFSYQWLYLVIPTVLAIAVVFEGIMIWLMKDMQYFRAD